ncbi:hypothetical protein C8J57DRAFT_234728 [Mycena rebaudengoi]|nr:hypothetical protein C8J57DRAFT_234728 [Mycena rebaudengoi]
MSATATTDSETILTQIPLPFSPQYPFDDQSNGDVILRSSDNVDFHVHRVVLSLASPFFKTMFCLPQPKDEPEVPVISTQESCLVLDRALRFWYPGAEPVIQNLTQLREVLEILISKYDMQFVSSNGKRYLREYLEKEAVAVFAIACHHRWGDVATEAARETLKLSLRVFDHEPSPEVFTLTTKNYHSLLRYHFRCGTAAKSCTDVIRWVDLGEWIWFVCTSCAGDGLHWFLSDSVAHPVRTWFIAYLKELGGNLMEKPGADVHKLDIGSTAVTKAAACSVCRVKVHEQFPRFLSSQLEPKLKLGIDKVKIELDF